MSNQFETQKPTEPGWYWCRNEGDYESEAWEAVVRVDRRPDGSLVCCWLTSLGKVGVLPEADWSEIAQWAGPISPPLN